MIGKLVFVFVVLALFCASIEKPTMTAMVVDGESGLDEKRNNMSIVFESNGENNQHTRHKRCLHDLFARLMVRLCNRNGCQNSAPIERPDRHHRVEWHSRYQSSWGNQQQQVQQQHEQEQEQQPQRSDISPSEAQTNEDVEDSHTSDAESEQNAVYGDDNNEIDEEETELMNDLKQFEHEYDRQLDVEVKLAEQAGESTNSRKLQRLAKNRQYTALKRKILSIPKRKKRIRLLRQLTTSFRNVIRVQKRISEGKKARIRAEARKMLTKPQYY